MQATSGGVGLGTILTIVFIVLKLTGKIFWSWWWVFSPLWLPVALAAAILIIVFVFAKAGDLIEG